MMDYATPCVGERLTLSDGRAFTLTVIEPAIAYRGWWWKAVAVSGERTLQGNRTLKRCGLTNGWGFA